MSKLIVEGSRLHCTLGVDDAPIKITSHSFVRIANALVATEADKEGIANIPTFGICKCSFPNPPCIPQPQDWQQTTQKDSINGMRKLTEQSFCLCAKGRRISFTYTGENIFVESR
jgi:hypothetical protein